MAKRDKTFTIKAQGNSMYPLLQDGDTVEYRNVPFQTIKLNDIVLLYIKNIFITHRVIYKTKNTCITRGDNNKAADVTTQKGRILAKVIRFKRKGVWYGIQDVYLTQSALYLHEIQMVETVLKIQKIPHVFLKGVLVSLRYENTIPKRIYADCDVLVFRADAKRIYDIFKQLGYKSKESLSTTKPEISFVKMVNGVPVIFDVHFEPVFLMTQIEGMNLLYPSKQLDELGKHIITQGENKKIKGFNYSLCSVSDQILYLALHIFHHNFTDSMRYQLLDAVIRKGSREWGELANTIKEYKLEGYIYGVFVLLKKYFKTPIPSSFLTVIRPRSYMLYVTRYIIKYVNIFSQDSRMKAGIQRIFLIFLLSPEPFWKKLLLFIHPKVLYTEAHLTFSFLSSLVSQARRRFDQGKASDYRY